MRLKDIPRIRPPTKDQDGQWIVYGKRNPFRQDHLFEDTSRSMTFGVYFSRSSTQGYNSALKKYLDFIAENSSSYWVQDAEQEAVIHFTAKNLDAIPSWFLKSKRKQQIGKERARCFEK